MTKILVSDAALAEQLAANVSASADALTWQVSESADEQAIARAIPDAAIYIGGMFTPAIADAAHALAFIQVPGAGLDEINLDVLLPHVVLANTYNHERSTAEYVVMTMLALSRRLLPTDTALRQGSWAHPTGAQDNPPFRTLNGQTVGIVGFGHIGQELASLVKPFGMKIIAIKRTADPVLANEWGLEFLGGTDDLPTLLTRSDFVVLAAPLTSETQHWLGARELALLKPNAYLINIARALLVDEKALFHVLTEHRIAGAALDVWYEYPHDDTLTRLANLPFHLLDNVILTPHYSGATEETRLGRLADMTYNLTAWLNHQPLRNIVLPRKHSPNAKS